MFSNITTIADSQEHLFQRSDRDSVTGYAECFGFHVKLGEKVLELRGIFDRDLEGYLTSDLAKHTNVGAQVLLQVWFDARVRKLRSLLHGEIIPDSVALFEEKTGAKANELTLRHDADSVTEHVSLVHIMCCQNDDPIVAVGSQHVPKGASGLEIHSTSRLIQHDELTVATEGDSDTELTLASTGKILSLGVSHIPNADIFEKLLDFGSLL